MAEGEGDTGRATRLSAGHVAYKLRTDFYSLFLIIFIHSLQALYASSSPASVSLR
jgi:hypothetical protein